MKIRTGFEGMVVGAKPTGTEGITGVNAPSGLTVIGTNAIHGNKALRLDGPASGTGYGHIAYSSASLGSYSRVEIVFGFRLDSLSSSERILCQVNDSAGGAAMRLLTRANGALSVWSAKDGSIRYVASKNLQAGVNYRIGYYLESGTDATNGKYRVVVYESEGTTPLSDSGLVTGNIASTVAGFGNIIFAKFDTATYDFSYVMDDIQINTEADATQNFAIWSTLTPPVITLEATAPSTAGGSDGKIVATWPAIEGAVRYESDLVNGISTSGFDPDDTNATSPKTYSGLTAGTYTVAVRAVG